MFSLFNKQPLIDEATSQWLFDAFAWSLKNFDSGFFYQHTVLVQPSNKFFPGKMNSAQGMAECIFDKVKSYAGTSHWPTLIADQNSCPSINTPKIEISGALRLADSDAKNAPINMPVDDANRLVIPYNPQQINNPEAMIASFAHIIAHYMGQMVQEPPPGGQEFWPQATELLAIFLGFGLMFANSAFTFRGGCGSCSNSQIKRDSCLTEMDATYALAIFSVLKEIPNSSVTPHLKKHLRGFYKKAVKEIAQNEDLMCVRKIK